MVGEAGLEACAGFLEGGAGACSLVGGAASWPSGGQGCATGHVWRWLWAQEVSRQSVCWCVGLCSRPVGRLAWGVPVLEPAGCSAGPGLSAKDPRCLPPAWVHSPLDGHSPLCPAPALWPQREPQLPPASPGDPPRPAGRSGPGSYGVTAFALGPGACDTLCVPSESGVSVSPSPVQFLRSSPAGLRSQMLWGLLPWCRTLRLRLMSSEAHQRHTQVFIPPTVLNIAPDKQAFSHL